MVDINVGSLSPHRAIEWTIPSATDRGAGRVLNYIGAIPLQHYFSGVAGPGLRAPMWEEVAAVAGLRANGGYTKSRELTACGGAGGDVGWDGSWGWGWDGAGVGVEDGEEEREKD